MRVGFLMSRYSPMDRSNTPAVVQLLRERGVHVDTLHWGDALCDIPAIRPEHDLYVLKDKSDVVMSLAHALHEAGAQILNPYPVSAVLRDRIATFHRLSAAGVPTPESFSTTQPAKLAAALDQGPLIVKPVRGSRGRGVKLVRNAADIESLTAGDAPVFAQRYYAGDGLDRKLYSIGEELFGVLRVWPPRTHEDKLGVPFTPDGELAEIARRCGAAMGIDLFGVDIVISNGEPWVVDMSSLPGFKGVPDAAQRLASYIHAKAHHGIASPTVPVATATAPQPRAADEAAGSTPARPALRATVHPIHAARVAGRRIHFLLARRVPPVPSPVLVEVYEHLKRRGFAVDGIIADEVVTRPSELAPEHDLYVLKSHTELSLSLAGALHLQGARTLNPYPSCAVTQNKILAAWLLDAAGVPTPETWLTGDLALLAREAARRPLIIKPYLGHRGAGLHFVRTPDDLARVPRPETPVLIQEYVEGSGEDLKVYVVGEHVFAVRKPFSTDSFTRPGEPAEVTDELREIALRCGRAFGLGLYGLDVIESGAGPRVVDLNTFPGYKGVPDVAPLIADYIAGYATGEITLLPEAPLPTAVPVPAA
jgi:ribosomal protein S6--L-glutamate ligase